MHKKYNKVWEESLKYLHRGTRRDFVMHTKNVVKAMELIIDGQDIDRDIMIVSAITHDIGWAKVPAEIQNNYKIGDNQIKGEELHIKHAPELVNKVLSTNLNYRKEFIEKVIKIVVKHKSKNPKTTEERLLIDADNLSDIFKNQFYDDVKKYEISFQQNLEFRSKNKFYTKKSGDVFRKEYKKRLEEINSKFRI